MPRDSASFGRLPLFLFGLCAIGGCSSDTVDRPEPIGRTDQASIVDFGYLYELGMLLTFSEAFPSGLNLSQTIGLAACDETALYAVQQDYSLHFSNDSGQTWRTLSTYGLGPELACDHGTLVTMNGGRTVYAAQTLSNGDLQAFGDCPISTGSPWCLQNTSPQVDHIQGGD